MKKEGVVLQRPKQKVQQTPPLQAVGCAAGGHLHTEQQEG